MPGQAKAFNQLLKMHVMFLSLTLRVSQFCLPKRDIIDWVFARDLEGMFFCREGLEGQLS